MRTPRVPGFRAVAGAVWLLWLTGSNVTVSAGVILSEIVPVNRGGLQDEKGDTPDWIELHHSGDEPVALGGFALSDDPEDPARWRFPDVTLNPGAFLVVFASGKDRADPGGTLHTNFKLAAEGEFVGLFDRDGALVSSLGPGLPPLEKSQSFGIPFDERGRPRVGSPAGVLAEATPAAANATRVETPSLRPPEFSETHGFPTEPFDLTLTTPEAALIRYTLDGSTPGENTGLLYREPIRISTTTVVRAVAFRVPGMLPSAVHTQSYLFLEDVAGQPDRAPEGWPAKLSTRRGGTTSYGMHAPETIGVTREDLVEGLAALPSLSLATDSEHLFGRRGLWTRSQYRGREWERPVSVELIDPARNEKGFQINAGVRIRGGFSRDSSNPKHALRLYFRKEYGESKLRYPLFGKDGAQRFADIDLRTAQNYSWSFEQGAQNSMVREVFSRDTQADMGRTHTRSRFYHLYLNGVYWGIYQSQEHAEASFGAEYFGGEPEAYDAVKSNGYAIEATDGTLDGWNRLWSLAKALAESADPQEREALYLRLQGCDLDGSRHEQFPVYVDVPGLIDYMLVVFYTGMWDGPITRYSGNSSCRNWFGLWNRAGQFGFQFFCHDFEHSLGVADSLNVDRTGPFEAGWDVTMSNPQWIHQQLMASESYLAAFQKRAVETLEPGGLLSPEINAARLNRRVAQLDRAIVAESARWGGSLPLTKQHWRSEIAKIYDFFQKRGEIVRTQLSEAKRFATGSPYDLKLPAPLYPGAGTGSVAPPGIAMRPGGIFFTHADAATIYFTLDGSDPMNPDGQPAGSAHQAEPERVEWTTLLQQAPMRAHVPRDGSLGDRWIAPEFDDGDWIAGRGAAGYETKPLTGGGTLYHRYLGLDLVTVAHEKNCSAYLRFPFNLDDGSNIGRLMLRMRYDDGFVAYLNGTRIASANAPAVLGWNSRASGKHDDNAAVVFVDFDVSAQANLLRSGPNLLAIHGLNDYLESSDMLQEPELAGGTVASGTAVGLDGGYKTISARARLGTEWSGLARHAERAGAAPATAASLVVTEIHYHPAQPTDEETAAGFDDGDAFEFVELANRSAGPIDLAVTQLAGGISFVFLSGEQSLLAPGSRCVIVENEEAFRARYGDEAKVAGEFRGKLANSGDHFQLIGAEGTVLHEIRFNDKSPWPKAADGDGPSLELKSLDSTGAALSSAGAWKASAQTGGTPGR